MSGVGQRPVLALVLGIGVLVVGTAVFATVLGGVSYPALFMALAGTMLVLALVALYHSFRGVFGDRAGAGLRTSLPQRAALLDEKNALLRAIKDVAYEHEVGKLSHQDFQRLDRAYRLRAKEVLRLLDEDLAPFIERAEALVRAELEIEEELASRPKPAKKPKAAPGLECSGCGTRNAADAQQCERCGGRLAPLDCASCGTRNDPDAKFCKKCAAALTQPRSDES